MVWNSSRINLRKFVTIGIPLGLICCLCSSVVCYPLLLSLIVELNSYNNEFFLSRPFCAVLLFLLAKEILLGLPLCLHKIVSEE